MHARERFCKFRYLPRGQENSFQELKRCVVSRDSSSNGKGHEEALTLISLRITLSIYILSLVFDKFKCVEVTYLQEEIIINIYNWHLVIFDSLRQCHILLLR